MALSRPLFVLLLIFGLSASRALAATIIPLTVNLSEAVNVDSSGGTPRIAVDVGGNTRYAAYTSGSGTSALTFTLSPQFGDVDLDGIALSSPVDLNGGTIKDLQGNDASLTFTPPNTSGVKVNYPSLSMDFVADADGRYTLNGTAYNDLTSFLSATGGTFSRTSIGAYFDSSGTLQTAAAGVPRFDYDPVSHTPKGILIEEARTNLLTYSTRMDNAVWHFGSGSGTKTTGQSAPDGSTDATLLAGPTPATTAHRGDVFATSTSMTYSVYAKYASGAQTKSFLLRNQTTVTNFDGCSINIQTGAVISGCTGWTITSIGNGWYRLAYTRTTGISVGNELMVYYGKTGASTNADESWILWGAQLEAGSFETSYIPTTSSTATRSGDVFTIPTGSWFNSAQGSFYARIHENSSLNTTGGGSPLIGTGLLGRFWYRINGTAQYYTYDGTNILSGPTITLNSDVRFASKYGPSGLGISANGSVTASAPFDGTWQNQGYATVASSIFNGWISNWKYYPSQAPNSQLQLLTQ